jgi:cell wall-associated NlpC family hydrolase
MRFAVRLALLCGALISAATVFVSLGLAALVGGPGTSLLPGLAAIVPASGPGTASPSAAATAAVAWALAQRGTPYRWGGEGAGGFDCSGLVQAAYGAAGVALPRVAQDQYDAGPQLAPGTPLRPGDLVFFGSSPRGVDHVGMVVGPGQMVDAPHTGAVVRVEPIWTDGFIGATRPAP